MEPICASELRKFPMRYRIQQIEDCCQRIFESVLDAANYKSSYYVDLLNFQQFPKKMGGQIYYKPTSEELVTYLKDIFIDCKIEYVEEEGLSRHGVKMGTLIKKGIMIDWS